MHIAQQMTCKDVVAQGSGFGFQFREFTCRQGVQIGAAP